MNVAAAMNSALPPSGLVGYSCQGVLLACSFFADPGYFSRGLCVAPNRSIARLRPGADRNCSLRWDDGAAHANHCVAWWYERLTSPMP